MKKLILKCRAFIEKVFDCDLMVVSPGVPSDAEVIKNAKSKNIKVISELEFASSYCKGNVIGITGTNGKTTTTSLCGYLFNECGNENLYCRKYWSCLF